jgi:hypothetical protein
LKYVYEIDLWFSDICIYVIDNLEYIQPTCRE